MTVDDVEDSLVACEVKVEKGTEASDECVVFEDISVVIKVSVVGLSDDEFAAIVESLVIKLVEDVSVVASVDVTV